MKVAYLATGCLCTHETAGMIVCTALRLWFTWGLLQSCGMAAFATTEPIRVRGDEALTSQSLIRKAKYLSKEVTRLRTELSLRAQGEVAAADRSMPLGANISHTEAYRKCYLYTGTKKFTEPPGNFVLSKRGFIYFEVPKSASTAIRRALGSHNAEGLEVQ